MFVATSGTQVAELGGFVALLLIAGTVAHFGPSSLDLSHRWQPWQAVGLTLPATLLVVEGAMLSGTTLATTGHEALFVLPIPTLKALEG